MSTPTPEPTFLATWLWGDSNRHVTHRIYNIEKPSLLIKPEADDSADDQYAAVLVGKHFEAIPTTLSGKNKTSGFWYYFPPLSEYPLELSMHIYFPIDPRIRRVDVQGAVKAYPNADNTGWLFAHTDEGTHHDYELQLLAACDGLFQPLFRQYQVDAYNPSATAATRGKTLYTHLSAFYGEVVVQVRTIARGAYLGEREQMAHPSEGWLDRDITAAIAAVTADWTENHSANLAELKNAGALTYLTRSLTMPAVETRWDREARLEAEKKAAEKAAAEAEAEAGANTESEGANDG